MDSETIFKTIVAVLGNDRYRAEAELIFVNFIMECEELTENQKSILIKNITSFVYRGGSIDKARLQEIMDLLMKSPTFEKYVSDRFNLRIKSNEC